MSEREEVSEKEERCRYCNAWTKESFLEVCPYCKFQMCMKCVQGRYLDPRNFSGVLVWGDCAYLCGGCNRHLYCTNENKKEYDFPIFMPGSGKLGSPKGGAWTEVTTPPGPWCGTRLPKDHL